MDNAPTLLFGAPEGGQKRGGKSSTAKLVYEVSASVFFWTREFMDNAPS
jgi:hypothetical protein